MTSIRDGYRSSINSMAAAMTNCNSCGTVACENLAKLVAHAWLKANKVPETGTAPSSSTSGGCAKRSLNKGSAAGLVLLATEDDCFIGHSSPSSRQNQNALSNIANGYSSGINDIITAAALGNCTGVNAAVARTASAYAKAYGCTGIYNLRGSGSGSSATPAPKPTGPDADCVNYGGLGGFADGICVSLKKLTKGAEAGVQNPLTQYLPIMLIGMGFLAILMLAKK